MANIRAFQACDESSILSARTTDESLKTSELSGVFLLSSIYEGSIEKVMIVEFSELAAIRSQHIDKKIVLSSGAFDLFHVNHLHYLEEARKYGELLVVVISNDETIRLSKGDSRPIYPERDRAEIINGIKVVDYVLIEPAGNGKTDARKVHADIFLTLKPDIFVTANDNWASLKRVIGSVELITLPRITGGRHSSTSAIVEHVRSSDFI